MKNIVIIGAGGFAREVQWLINDINNKEQEWKLLGFVDENIENRGKVLNGALVLGDFKDIVRYQDEEVYYACAVASPEAKLELSTKAESMGLKPAILIHPSVIISDFVDIGEGSIICAGSIVTVNIKIGKHVIVNLDCTIGHDAVIEDFCTILPSVNVSGNTNIGKFVSMGTGSSIIQGLKIGPNSTIGAGAVVVSDIPNGSTAVGIPAKVIKNRD